jgi:hypothetical protein
MEKKRQKAEARKIVKADDILTFIADRTEQELMMSVFKEIALPMFRQYFSNPTGKDYIAYNQEIGYCFLAEKEILKKTLVNSN